MTTRRRMVYELAEVDKRRSKQEVAQEGGKAGGRGRGDSLAPDGAKQKDHRAHKSAAATAAVVGVSPRVVERARTVLDKATDEVNNSRSTRRNSAKVARSHAG